jgi:metal-responsive CopG/Arc/MetJ family transcriptional regulator
MATVKTAISVDETLFNQVDELARELGLPRSQVFAMAAQQFVEQRRNRKMIDALNEVYGDTPDRDDDALLDAMRQHQRDLLENAW